eukprot:CAMPEP_0183733764 /NCGR_PEP_ID=MMETSP0737-20130205/41944_2 /TAXON_ID=385413 /ORGANISM="Thalassiosira miniscula, Strain CCMP1093" /LENGTH=54 /DNA_ID=CAMNT_0025967083 /DNA_START=23 /DNA_END=183 /DNA_ORIENTATION=-
MKADLFLSRSSYRSGTPVVGTVRIYHDTDTTPAAVRETSIRREIVSARLYLAGR